MRTMVGLDGDRPSRSTISLWIPPRDSGVTATRWTESGRASCTQAPASRCAASVRTVPRSPTLPTNRLRAKATTAWLDASSHCTSSTAINTGPWPARRCNTDSSAAPNTCSSVAGPSSALDSTLSSAIRCIGGSSAKTAGSTSPNRSANIENVNVTSAAPARAIRTRKPRVPACSTASSHSVVLPIPASPSISNTEACPSAESRNAVTAFNSSGRATRPAFTQESSHVIAARLILISVSAVGDIAAVESCSS